MCWQEKSAQFEKLAPVPAKLTFINRQRDRTVTLHFTSNRAMPTLKVTLPASFPSQAQPLEQSQVDALGRPADNFHLTSTQAINDLNKTVIANMQRISEDEKYRLEVSKKLS